MNRSTTRLRPGQSIAAMKNGETFCEAIVGNGSGETRSGDDPEAFEADVVESEAKSSITDAPASGGSEIGGVTSSPYAGT